MKVCTNLSNLLTVMTSYIYNIYCTDIALVIGLERESYTVSEAIRVVNASGSGNTTGEDTTVVQQTSVRVCAVVLNGTIENGTSARVRFTTESGTARG